MKKNLVLLLGLLFFFINFNVITSYADDSDYAKAMGDASTRMDELEDIVLIFSKLNENFLGVAAKIEDYEVKQKKSAKYVFTQSYRMPVEVQNNKLIASEGTRDDYGYNQECNDKISFFNMKSTEHNKLYYLYSDDGQYILVTSIDEKYYVNVNDKINIDGGIILKKDYLDQLSLKTVLKPEYKDTSSLSSLDPLNGYGNPEDLANILDPTKAGSIANIIHQYSATIASILIFVAIVTLGINIIMNRAKAEERTASMMGLMYVSIGVIIFSVVLLLYSWLSDIVGEQSITVSETTEEIETGE